MPEISLLFAGQGAQYVGMGRDLYESSPAAKQVFDMGEELLPGILDICFSSDKETLSKTENTQPALFLTDLACAYALRERGIEAKVAAGFSLGEIAALAYCGILSDRDAFTLVCKRGKVMAECAERHPGAMAAVLKLDRETVESVASEFSEVYPVNYNCPGQISVAGSKDEMPVFCARIKEVGGRAVPLAVSGAFHSPYMKDASAELRTALEGLEINAPKIPLYANLTAKKYPTDKESIINTIANQASSSVRFEETLRGMKEQGIDTFIEVGAGKTLSGFVNRTLENVTVMNIENSEGLAQVCEALGK